jgi:hypothetical protein
MSKETNKVNQTSKNIQLNKSNSNSKFNPDNPDPIPDPPKPKEKKTDYKKYLLLEC